MATLTVLERRERHYLGVDVGRRTHTVCAVSRSTFETGGTRWQHAPTLTVPVNRAGFERIRVLLHRLSDDPARDVIAGLEPTGGYYARTVHAYLRGLHDPINRPRGKPSHAGYRRKCRTSSREVQRVGARRREFQGSRANG